MFIILFYGLIFYAILSFFKQKNDDNEVNYTRLNAMKYADTIAREKRQQKKLKRLHSHKWLRIKHQLFKKNIFHHFKNKPVVKEITVEDFKKMRDEGADFQLIDVREPHEFTAADMGGELIPLGTILEAQDRIAKDKPVIMQCRSGMRSANAVMTLQRFFPGEYDNLYNLKGGILAWAATYDKTLRVE